MFGNGSKFMFESKLNSISREIDAEANRLKSEWISARRAAIATVATPKIEAKTETVLFQGKKALEFGKQYNYKGVLFQVFRASSLSVKQAKVVRSFIHGLYAPLNAPESMSFERVAPWIDLIFKFNRREISVGMFNEITGLNIEISVFDNRHQHNL